MTWLLITTAVAVLTAAYLIVATIHELRQPPPGGRRNADEARCERR